MKRSLHDDNSFVVVDLSSREFLFLAENLSKGKANALVAEKNKKGEWQLDALPYASIEQGENGQWSISPEKGFVFVSKNDLQSISSEHEALSRLEELGYQRK